MSAICNWKRNYLGRIFFCSFKSDMMHPSKLSKWTRKNVWDNGDTYQGVMENGKTHGQGTLVWANGDTYEGEWENGAIHGQGTYVWANGDTYEGEWKNGEMYETE